MTLGDRAGPTTWARQRRGRVGVVSAALAGLLLASLAAACAEPTEVASSAADAAPPPPVEVPGRGTYVDFQWAVEPSDLAERARRLEAFLVRYDPAVHGLEDAVHLRFYRVARYRLLHAYYHLGRLGAADSILGGLEATDADIR